MARQGQFKPGNPGKPKGAISHFNRTVKEVVLETFNKLQANPAANMLAWAEEEPGEFYKIASKLIPTDVKSQVAHTITLKIDRKGSNTSTEYLASGSAGSIESAEEV